MPPRYAYWTIILEGQPTAFRARSREELLPTLRQLQSRHPDVVLKWFARGRLWESPEEERGASTRAGERRGPSWRPGGEHRDPRERFKVPRDVKRRHFAARKRVERRDRSGTQPPREDRPPRTPRPERPDPREQRPRTRVDEGPRPERERPRRDSRRKGPRIEKPRTWIRDNKPERGRRRNGGRRRKR